MFIASIIYNCEDMETNMCSSKYEWIKEMCILHICVCVCIYIYLQWITTQHK